MQGRRTWLAVGICLLASAAVPAVASANTYCVSDPECVAAGGINSGSDPQDAFDDAVANAGHDRIEIGPGTFNSPTGFIALVGGPNTMEIVGAGSELTILTTPDSSTSRTTLTIGGSSPTSSVSDLAAVAPGSIDPENIFPSNEGIDINGGGTLERVKVTADPQHIAGGGIELAGTLRDSTVSMSNTSGIGAVRVTDTLAGVIEDSTLSGFYGVYADSNTTTATEVLIRRTRIEAAYSGVYTQGSEVTVENSLIEFGTLAGGAGVYVITGPMVESVSTVRNTTIVGDGGDSGILALGLDAGQPVSAHANSSIIRNVLNSLNRVGNPGTASITATYSNYTNQTSSTGAGTLTEGAGNTAFADPGFVNAGAGNYALTVASRLRDIGSPATFTGESATDLGGSPRISNGRRDMGAFEFQAKGTCAGRKVTLLGTPRADTLAGTPGADVIVALGGKDVVRGLAGNDFLCGGAGNDRLAGGGGRDTLLGQAGSDTLRGGPKRDLLRGGPGPDLLIGGPGRDLLRGGPGRDRERQ